MAASSRRPTKERTIQVAFRLPLSLVEELDAEAERIAPAGIEINRTDVARVLLREALEARRKATARKR